MRFSVDPWAVEYGSSLDVELDVTTADVNPNLEVDAGEWKPIDPTPSDTLRRLLFIDGVRRIDARVWIEEPDGEMHPGVCATYAAGAVCCGERAELVAAEVERSMFSAAPSAATITTRHGDYVAKMATAGTNEALFLAVHERMTALEARVAEAARDDASIDLIVIDGPLRGRQHVSGTIGFIKSHNVAYLPPDLHAIVAKLDPLQRTPVFTIGTSWSRHSWYLRLPGPEGSPWAGIARCECSADLTRGEAVALADRSAAALPRFASEQHKDQRAPQNLYPIRGLEDALRRRLGDQLLMYRALRIAA